MRQSTSELTCRLVLLHDVAVVVEFREGGGQLVQVVTEVVKVEVVCAPVDDLRETNDQLGQVPLLWMFKGGRRGLLEVRHRHPGLAGNGPGADQGVVS